MKKKEINMAYAAYSPLVGSKSNRLYSFSKSNRFDVAKSQS